MVRAAARGRELAGGGEQGVTLMVNHDSDEECAPFLDENRECTACGLSHPEQPCASCGGYAQHKPNCATPDELSDE